MRYLQPNTDTITSLDISKQILLNVAMWRQVDVYVYRPLRTKLHSNLLEVIGHQLYRRLYIV